MKIKVSSRSIFSQKSSLAVFLTTVDEKNAQFARVEADLGSPCLSELAKDFPANEEEICVFYSTMYPNMPRVAFLGLGRSPTLDVLRKVFSTLACKVKELKITDFSLDLSGILEYSVMVSDTPAYVVQAGLESFLNALYEYDKFKTNNFEVTKKTKSNTKSQKPLTSLTIYVKPTHLAKIQKAVEIAQIISSSQSNTRDLVNSPSNHLSAEGLSKYIKDSAKKYGYKATVYGKKKIEELGLGGLIAVNKGSDEPPTFNIMEYKPEKSKMKVALVGKGVMFDTGGISLKPSAGMGEMKADMAGAAAVIGAVETATRLHLPIHLYGVIPATDNKPDGRAQNPGDVITTQSGITVEVDNTDAEGRLILADALSYAKSHLRPDIIIDLATLTGACVVALGSHAAGLFSTNEDIAAKLFSAGLRSGEKVWQLPLWDEYDKQIKSSIADVKNTGSGGAGAITAGKFLEKFVGGHAAWAHIDIAGPSIPKFMNSGNKVDSLPGFGVRLLTEFLKNL